MKKWVLILGATSAIAHGVARAFAKKGFNLYLAGRDLDELERRSLDLSIRYGVEVKHGKFDADNIETHEKFLSEVLIETTLFTGVVLAVGYMGDQIEARNFPNAGKVIQTNFVGPVSILSRCANLLEDQGEGFIVGISSVAGDRGRQSNYVYGAAKGGLSLYLQGLRNRLQPSGVQVLTVKPGFVDTAMTYGLPGLFLVATPDYVGERIVNGLEKKHDVIYTPWFWRYIMLIIRSIPEKIFKKLKL